MQDHITNEATSYGVKITFTNFTNKEAIDEWRKENTVFIKDLKNKFPNGFVAVIDMVKLPPLPQAAIDSMIKGQQDFSKNGMGKSAVGVKNAITAGQFKKIAMQSGIYATERYFDAEKDPGWEKSALDWVQKGIDPDKK